MQIVIVIIIPSSFLHHFYQSFIIYIMPIDTAMAMVKSINIFSILNKIVIVSIIIFNQRQFHY